MLTVVIDARGEAGRLAGLLAQLTAGAVEGLVREVLIVAAEGQPDIDLLCEETGAEAVTTLEAAASARADWLMVLPADLRLRDGWIQSVEDHLARGGGEAVVQGLARTGLFRPAPLGVLVERRRLDGLGRGADLKRLRRDLGLRPRRVG